MNNNNKPKEKTSEISVGLNIDGGMKTGAAVIIPKTVISFLGSLGSVMCLLTLVLPRHDFTSVYIAAAVSSLVCMTAAFLPKGGNVLTGTAFFGLAAAFFRLRNSIAVGGMYIFNEFYTIIKIRYRGLDFFDMTDYSPDEITGGINTAIILSSALIAFLTGVFMIYRTAVIPLFLVTFPTVEAVLYHGLVPSYGWVIMTVCCWGASAAAEAAELPVVGRERQIPVYLKTAGQASAVTAVMLGICFAASAAAVKISGFERTDKMMAFRRDFSNYVSHFSFEKFKNDLSAMNPVNPDISGAINHGRLGRTDEIDFTHQTMLRVTVPKTADNIYFKGFVGAEYTGNSWLELSGEALDKQDRIISRFETEGLSPSFMDGYFLEGYSERGSGSISERRIYAEAVGANKKFCYLPYYITPESAAKLKITSDKAEPADTLSLKCYALPAVQRYAFLKNNPFSENYGGRLSADEAKYRGFVYENYLDVPSAFTAAEAIYGDTPMYDLQTELLNIKMWLALNCEYDLAAGRLPFGKDFAQYFITESRKGSCSHFATAAVLMCRYRGIPARYAEGYVIKSDDFPENIGIGENAVIELTDERAHAWIEVYLDGYGWMPFEVTPGYSELSETAVPTEPNANAVNASPQLTPPPEAEETAAGTSVSEVTEIAEVTESAEISRPITVTEISETADDEELWDDEDDGDTYGEEEEQYGITDGGEAPGNVPPPEKRKINILPIMIVLAVILVPTGLLALRYRNITGARARRLGGSNSRKKAHAAGKYFMELCAYKKMRKLRGQSYEEFAELAEKQLPKIKEGAAAEIIGAALESGYGEGAPDKETADNAAALSVKYAEAVYEQLNGRDRFIFKYLLCLRGRG